MADVRDLLFELGTEELPPKTLLTLRDALHENVQKNLEKTGLSHGPIQAYATPRRLALYVRDLAAAQPGKVVERRGPALVAAYTADGTPTQAALGFAKGCGTTVDRLGTLKTDKGEWLAYHESVPGAPSETLIPDIIRDALAALPIAKRMRWGASSTEFVRPVHWAVLIFGEKTLETEILGVTTGLLTYGHRFHRPSAIPITQPHRYAEILEDEGFVIADFDARRRIIEAGAREAAARAGGMAHIEVDLLDEVTALNEWPVPILGDFEAGFLNLPSEVLITTMQSNQKYFPVEDGSGHLLPHFITFSNVDSSNPDAVKRGNERVIRPRLTDAEFFWQKDRSRPLASRVDALAHIVFQNKLGTLADKTARVENLAAHIARLLNADVALAVRAAHLAKADLLTEMVNEFANLQGTMGRYYALADGEPEAVAVAIEEQYYPKQSGGDLPGTSIGQIVSIAEKIDTLTGIFSAGLIPSGDKDPYALRRAALGALRILIERRLDLDLPALVAFALGQYTHDFDRPATQDAVNQFIVDRLKGYCLDRGHGSDAFDAVAALTPSRPLDFEMRLQAVAQFRELPEAGALAGANKRIRNLLRKAGAELAADVDEKRFEHAEENALFRAARAAREEVLPLTEARDYTAALKRLAHLRPAVDDFFDKVMVMADDAAVRRNRLALLALLESLFLAIADIAKLQIHRPEETASNPAQRTLEGSD